MKRKVFMALAIGAGCCLITGNVLMAQPSASSLQTQKVVPILQYFDFSLQESVPK